MFRGRLFMRMRPPSALNVSIRVLLPVLLLLRLFRLEFTLRLFCELAYRPPPGVLLLVLLRLLVLYIVLGARDSVSEPSASDPSLPLPNSSVSLLLSSSLSAFPSSPFPLSPVSPFSFPISLELVEGSGERRAVLLRGEGSFEPPDTAAPVVPVGEISDSSAIPLPLPPIASLPPPVPDKAASAAAAAAAANLRLCESPEVDALLSLPSPILPLFSPLLPSPVALLLLLGSVLLLSLRSRPSAIPLLLPPPAVLLVYIALLNPPAPLFPAL
mmetsp:Transcript_17575/g.30574  ORF Transcript_17575/g.30574 Transcript_17575/m.30574 type:complete len:271 (-) Transcript_17575:654-1466(-)